MESQRKRCVAPRSGVVNKCYVIIVWQLIIFYALTKALVVSLASYYSFCSRACFVLVIQKQCMLCQCGCSESLRHDLCLTDCLLLYVFSSSGEEDSSGERGSLHTWKGYSYSVTPERVLLSRPVLQAALGTRHGVLLVEGESQWTAFDIMATLLGL